MTLTLVIAAAVLCYVFFLNPAGRRHATIDEDRERKPSASEAMQRELDRLRYLAMAADHSRSREQELHQRVERAELIIAALVNKLGGEARIPVKVIEARDTGRLTTWRDGNTMELVLVVAPGVMGIRKIEGETTR